MLKNIKIERVKKELTQEQLAKELGISSITVSKTENGKTIPNYKTIKKMADFFGVSVDYLTEDHKAD